MRGWEINPDFQPLCSAAYIRIVNPRNCKESLENAALKAWEALYKYEDGITFATPAALAICDKIITNANLTRPRNPLQMRSRLRICDTWSPLLWSQMRLWCSQLRHQRAPNTKFHFQLKNNPKHVWNSYEQLGLQIKHPHKSKNIIQIGSRDQNTKITSKTTNLTLKRMNFK